MDRRSARGGRRRKLAYIAACSTALSIILLFLLWPAHCLTIERGGKLLLAWPISKGERFEITFTHSLNLSPITDVIEWDGRDLVVIKSIFKAFGAGVPVPADGLGDDLVFVDGHYELIGIDSHMQSIPIMVQEAPNHFITLNGCDVYLLELAGSGSVADVMVKPIPRFVRLMLRSGR